MPLTWRSRGAAETRRVHCRRRVDDADATIAERRTRDNSYIGRPLPRRLRTERETAGSYLAAQTGGLAYMVAAARAPGRDGAASEV